MGGGYSKDIKIIIVAHSNTFGWRRRYTSNIISFNLGKLNIPCCVFNNYAQAKYNLKLAEVNLQQLSGTLVN